MRGRIQNAYERDLPIPFTLYKDPEIIGRSSIPFDSFLDFVYQQQRYLHEQHAVEPGPDDYVNPLPLRNGPSNGSTIFNNTAGAFGFNNSAAASFGGGASGSDGRPRFSSAFANQTTATGDGRGSSANGAAAGAATAAAIKQRMRASVVSFESNANLLADNTASQYYNHYNQMLQANGSFGGGGSVGGGPDSFMNKARVPLLRGQLWDALELACRHSGRDYTVDVRVSRNSKKKNALLFKAALAALAGGNSSSSNGGDGDGNGTAAASLNAEMMDKAKARFCHYLFSFSINGPAPATSVAAAAAAVETKNSGNFYASPTTPGDAVSNPFPSQSQQQQQDNDVKDDPFRDTNAGGGQLNSARSNTYNNPGAAAYNVHEYLLYGMREVPPWRPEYLTLLQECVYQSEMQQQMDSGASESDAEAAAAAKTKVPEYVRALLHTATISVEAGKKGTTTTGVVVAGASSSSPTPSGSRGNSSSSVAAAAAPTPVFSVDHYCFAPLTVGSAEAALDAIVPPRLMVYYEVDPDRASENFHRQRRAARRVARLQSDIVNRQYQRWRQKNGRGGGGGGGSSAIGDNDDDANKSFATDDQKGGGNSQDGKAAFRVKLADRRALLGDGSSAAGGNGKGKNGGGNANNNNSNTSNNNGGDGKDDGNQSNTSKKANGPAAAAAAAEDDDDINDDKHLWLELFQLQDDLAALRNTVVGERVVLVERASRTQSARREMLALEENLAECLRATRARCVGISLSDYLRRGGSNSNSNGNGNGTAATLTNGRNLAPLSGSSGSGGINNNNNTTTAGGGGGGKSSKSGGGGSHGGAGTDKDGAVVYLTTRPGSRPQAAGTDGKKSNAAAGGGTASALPTLNVVELNKERHALLCLLLQDELVRQVALDSTERAVLLRRVLSEARASCDAWETLLTEAADYSAGTIAAGHDARAELEEREAALQAEVAALRERRKGLQRRAAISKETAEQAAAADAKRREKEGKFRESLLERLRQHAEDLKALQDQQRRDSTAA